MKKFEQSFETKNIGENSSEKEIESMEDIDVLRRPSDFDLVKEHKQDFSLTVQKIIDKLAIEQEIWIAADEAIEFGQALGDFRSKLKYLDNADLSYEFQQIQKIDVEQNVSEERLIEKKSFKEIDKIKFFLKKIAEKMRQENIPVEDDCRVSIDAFGEVYTEEMIQKDKNLIKYKKSMFRSNNEKSIAGEKLEVLKTILFNKFLGDRFIVVRSSYYDDIINGVDNVLVERETGDVACMFDSILQPRHDKRFYGIKKIEKVRNINKKGGAMLKYGFDLGADGLISLKEIKNIPIFALVLEGRLLDKAMEKVKLSSLEQGSVFEEDVFRQMVGSLRPQIEILKKDRDLLSAELINRLDNFENNLDKLKI